MKGEREKEKERSQPGGHKFNLREKSQKKGNHISLRAEILTQGSTTKVK